MLMADSCFPDKNHYPGMQMKLILQRNQLCISWFLKGGLMYYLTERSVLANGSETALIQAEEHPGIPERGEVIELQEKEIVFSTADLWNLQKHMKGIHVTDRLPRTWEGL